MNTSGGAKHAGHQVLVVEADPAVASAVSRTLSASGFVVTLATSAGQALTELSRSHFHAALVDIYLGDQNGLTVLSYAAALDEPPAVVMMAGYADVSTVVSLMRSGAADFIEKPVDQRELVARVERVLTLAAERRKLAAYVEKERLSVAPPRPTNNGMRDALLLADRVAATPSSGALLIGESGAGKEVIAARIHERSKRRSGPFVRVNVAAIPSSMFEAELFGNVKGAYTDAKTNRAGYLASADGGTILLDEIGELRPESQVKLLRVLEERRFFPVGSDRQRSVDVRVIAATNREPQQMLDANILRLDLFYRLGSVIRVPPLRERKDEILPLAEHFVNLYCREFGRNVCQLTPSAARRLQSYAWPGNVRQLKNAIERAVMVTEGDEIEAAAFDLSVRPSPSGEPQMPAAPHSSEMLTGPPTPRLLSEIAEVASEVPSETPTGLHRRRRRAMNDALERQQIQEALQAANGSRAKAARLLGLSRSTLYEKLKRYSLD